MSWYGSGFNPGDKVEYCGDSATVVKNFGNHGTVEMSDGSRMVWYWTFQGEQVVLTEPQKAGE